MFNSQKNGFTLTELIVSLGIIAVLFTVAVVPYNIYMGKYMCKIAADEAAFTLRLLQQKAVTLEMEAGIYLVSETEYWAYIQPMSSDNTGFLQAAVSIPPPGAAPAPPAAMPAPEPSNILWKVKLERAKIKWPPPLTRIYFLPENDPLAGKWQMVTTYIWPTALPPQNNILMTFSSSNNAIGYKEISVTADIDNKIFVVDN